HGPEGDPHGRRPDPALLKITADEVLDALDALPEPSNRPEGTSPWNAHR
ncbi:glycosyltransferase family 9 protein, partial [Streptomyces sp. SID89]|nr:glycosyltransferase family 9 protein [Streptomyces sp. SID89]